MANIKKLLEGLGGENINVRALAAHTASNGVYASIHVGRLRGTVSLPPKLVGIKEEKMPEKTQVAYATYVSLGNLHFIPVQDEKTLSSIEGSLRYKLERATIADEFIPITKYLMFKDEFEEAKQAYFAERERIVGNWTVMVEAFEAGIDDIIRSAKLLKKDQIAVKKAVMSQLPTKEAYAKSFSMSLSVRAFPGQPDTTQLDPRIASELNESWGKTVVENAVACISALSQDIFDLCSNASARYAEKGIINGNSINSLILMGSKVKEGNVFRNPLLQEAAEKLDTLKSFDDADSQEEIIEDVMLSIYQYAKETGIEITFPKKGLSKVVLEGMLTLKMSA